MFIAALFTVARMWSSPSAQSAGECLKKLCYIYTMELLGCKKKKEILPFVIAWIDLESIMLSEISQSEKVQYHMISLICGI